MRTSIPAFIRSAETLAGRAEVALRRVGAEKPTLDGAKAALKEIAQNATARTNKQEARIVTEI